jgi:UDP-N-acetylmuramoyl-tripeptide--D-alanyl-D-alanine ligase
MTYPYAALNSHAALAVILALVNSAFVALACVVNGDRCLHVMQLNAYQIDGYFRSLRRSMTHDFWPLCALYAAGVGLNAATVVLVSAFPKAVAIAWQAALPALLFAFAALYANARKAAPQKKPLAMTERLCRLRRAQRVSIAVAATLFSFLGLLALWALVGVGQAFAAAVAFPAFAYAPLALLWVLTAFAAWLRGGAEKRINQAFVDDAKRILNARGDLVRIGITGSYGKTSAKFILGSILSEGFNVLVPPSSYNTPMGVTRMVREMLTPAHEAIIAEMGARHVGEIAELCDIIRPQYALLTSIGAQHLETFGSVENIINTKYEIMQALGEDGVGFFPNDGGACRKLYDGFTGNKRLFGFDAGDCDLWAEGIVAGMDGSSFVLCAAGERQPCTTKLLGAHNIMNILGAAAVAREMGMTLMEIARGIEKAQPVEHRLQLINPGNGVLVIDDAFNSNPEGAKVAMEVLSMFEGWRKICVTPGMVELGAREAQENRAFGRRMAKVCDHVVLVGETRAAPIAQGLAEEGFANENVHIVGNLDAATALLASLTRPGDVVLFENDLPDHYVS